jgi:hypothetical protein
LAASWTIATASYQERPNSGLSTADRLFISVEFQRQGRYPAGTAAADQNLPELLEDCLACRPIIFRGPEKSAPGVS